MIQADPRRPQQGRGSQRAREGSPGSISSRSASGWARGRALRSATHAAGLGRVFVADNFWGIAALLWLVTGLLRAMGPFEKGPVYYFSNRFFIVKLGLFAGVLALEIWPMATFIGWRLRLAGGESVEPRPARVFATISFAQALLITAIVFCAVGMARGFGMPRVP